MNSPKVSLLIPTYNYARFLPEAIESILAQDFADYEVVIVDDRSQDNTAEVVAPFCNRDRRISFEVNPANLGMVANWNLCLKKARGTYVKYLFGDDMLAGPKALGKLTDLLDSNPKATLASSARRIIDENSHPIATWDNWKKAGCFDGISVILECLKTGNNLVGEPTAVMFRRSLSLRGFNLLYRQLVDLEMWFHLLEQGDLVYSPEALCCFRRHGNQQTEVNKSAGLTAGKSLIGHCELLGLYLQYSDRPWYGQIPATQRAAILWALRRWRPSFPPLQFKFVESQLRKKVPLTLLCAYWLAHKTARPFENLKRSLAKRSRRTS